MATKLGKVMTYYEKEVSLDEVKQPFEQVITWDHVINKKHYISTATMLMANKLGMVVTYNEELSSIRSHDHMALHSHVKK